MKENKDNLSEGFFNLFYFLKIILFLDMEFSE